MAAGREDLTRKSQPGEDRATQVGGLRPSDIRSAEAFGAELDYVYRTFRRMGAQPAEAEDMAQDVFMVVWRRWADFERGPARCARGWRALPATWPAAISANLTGGNRRWRTPIRRTSSPIRRISWRRPAHGSWCCRRWR